MITNEQNVMAVKTKAMWFIETGSAGWPTITGIPENGTASHRL
jgi:hypothetical protein